MADLFQGSALPNITTTKTDVTSGPSWYNTYLSDLAQTGTKALERTPEQSVAGFSPLQTAAAAAVPGAAVAAQPYLTDAGTAIDKTSNLSAVSAANSAANPYISTGAATVPGVIKDYMDPYQQQVVNEIGRLGYENIRDTLRPMANARSVATGDFGSKRSNEIMGQTLRGALSDMGGLQSKALSSGYQSALTAAQADKTRMLTAGKMLGDLTDADYKNAMAEATTRAALGTTAQDTALKGIDATYKMGENEQKLAQARLNAPLTNATNAANVFTNLKVPTTVSQTANAPVPGAYANSPLSQIAGLGTLFSSGAGGSPSAVNNVLKSILGEKTYADVAAKGILGAITGAAGIGGVAGVADNPYKDKSKVAGDPMFGYQQNEDGTYTDPATGAIYDRNGVKIYEPANVGGGDPGRSQEEIDRIEREREELQRAADLEYERAERQRVIDDEYEAERIRAILEGDTVGEDSGNLDDYVDDYGD
jgi:hypothetical protein